MENPIKMDDLGVPLFSETSIYVDIYIYIYIYTYIYIYNPLYVYGWMLPLPSKSRILPGFFTGEIPIKIHRPTVPGVIILVLSSAPSKGCQLDPKG